MSTATISEKKRAANRANARKSTGPRTAEGKSRASLNAITHGLFCKELVLPGESQEVFALLRRLWISSLSPQDIAELWLVDRIVAANWEIAAAAGIRGAVSSRRQERSASVGRPG